MLQLVARSAIRRLVGEVRRLDDERVAFPVAAAHRRRTDGSSTAMCGRVVERNHARVVDHLVGDRHEARALMDVIRVAVDGRHHRAGDAARDAAVVEAAVFPRVGRAASLSRRLRARLRAAALPRSAAAPCRPAGSVTSHGAAVGGVVVLEPVHRARRARKLAQPRSALDRLLLPLLDIFASSAGVK